MKNQSFYHRETIQLIFSANQLTGFYIMRIFAVDAFMHDDENDVWKYCSVTFLRFLKDVRHFSTLCMNEMKGQNLFGYHQHFKTLCRIELQSMIVVPQACNFKH